MTTQGYTGEDFRGIWYEAYRRGYDRGMAERRAGYDRNDSPLSGEWAGESIPELLGDLIQEGETLADALSGSDDEVNPNDIEGMVCDEYEAGYWRAFDNATL